LASVERRRWGGRRGGDQQPSIRRLWKEEGRIGCGERGGGERKFFQTTREPRPDRERRAAECYLSAVTVHPEEAISKGKVGTVSLHFASEIDRRGGGSGGSLTVGGGENKEREEKRVPP